MDVAEIKRPVLSMPPEESAAVVEYYGKASVILEYGSGGSTVVAAEQAGKTIFSVENDAEWLAGMQAYFELHPPLARVFLHLSSIGPTRRWGYPSNDEQFRTWPSYPLGVWERPDFVHPDLVLLDGRFRVGCFLTALFRIERPVTLLWDDYTDRPTYHEVEALVKPVETIGRMARFELEPTPVPADRLRWIIENYLRHL